MECKKIYPSVEQLGTVCNLLLCTETGCPSVFKSESNLNLHLAKTHRKDNLIQCTKNIIREYYCPISSCVYNINKHFKSLKLLKQHFLKVHSEKNIFCDKCNKGFSTEALRNNHKEYCGIDFTCCECSSSYSCYDTLQTHARRKQHKIFSKNAYKSIDRSNIFLSEIESNEEEGLRETIGTQTIPVASNKTYSLGTQTFTLTPDDIFEFTDSSCQTMPSNSMEELYSNNFFNSETQTDLIFNSYFSSNTYTQTEQKYEKESIFNDIHTQTVFNNILKSVGSQTLTSLKKKEDSKDMAHIETQTEIAHLKQILDEINS